MVVKLKKKKKKKQFCLIADMTRIKQYLNENVQMLLVKRNLCILHGNVFVTIS